MHNINLSFPNKICLEDFSANICPDNCIAIIARNGSGKSSMLDILCQKTPPTEGNAIIPDGICIGHVEQIISDFNDLSGGQRSI